MRWYWLAMAVLLVCYRDPRNTLGYLLIGAIIGGFMWFLDNWDGTGAR